MSVIHESFSRWLGRRFLSRLVSEPRGRAFLFDFMANAEENDEGAFDDLLTRVGSDVEKVVRRHRDDEQRHARLLRECLARTGIEPDPLPAELRYIDRIDRMTGAGFRRGFLEEEGALGIMKVYAMLQIVEERGVTNFSLIAEALERVDPESARIVTEIVADERRHVQYARAISRRYAPDEATLHATLAQFRKLEARAFEQHGRAQLRFALQHELFSCSGAGRLFWKVATLGPGPSQAAG